MQVIFNADDWGRSTAVNAAVLQAHREGLLTSASLMVTGEAVDEAVSMARSTPTLAVGLHVVVAGGRAVLPPAQIPHLVDAAGRFPDDPLRAGLHYAFSRAARQELAWELAAQFDHFAAWGLPLSHVDCHMHLHVHPAIFDLLLPLAEQYGASGLRLPRDDLGLALRYDRRHAGTKIAWVMSLSLLCRRHEGRLRRYRLVATQRVYGLLQSGQMEEAYVVGVLRRLRVPAAELYFHPTTLTAGDALGPNPGDLATLLSPRVRQVICERGLDLTTYPALAQTGR